MTSYKIGMMLMYHPFPFFN